MTQNRAPDRLPFMKMHGLGNDFVVIDARERDVQITPELARRIGDRNFGVGFDQLALISSGDDDALAKLTFLNADGSTSATCGNATRCIARHLINETGQAQFALRTERGLLQVEDAGGGLTRVNLGPPLLDWQDIPLAEECDTLSLPLPGDPVATSMGNPHCTFFVDDIEGADLEAAGRAIETHPMFPERTNVELVEVKDRQTILARVWERGVGVTLASGSCASASAVSAIRRDLVEGPVTVVLDGGSLEIDWRDDGVWMTGPTAHVYDGVWHG